MSMGNTKLDRCPGRTTISGPDLKVSKASDNVNGVKASHVRVLAKVEEHLKHLSQCITEEQSFALGTCTARAVQALGHFTQV
jgi:hypothetical protein